MPRPSDKKRAAGRRQIILTASAMMLRQRMINRPLRRQVLVRFHNNAAAATTRRGRRREGSPQSPDRWTAHRRHQRRSALDAAHRRKARSIGIASLSHGPILRTADRMTSSSSRSMSRPYAACRQSIIPGQLVQPENFLNDSGDVPGQLRHCPTAAGLESAESHCGRTCSSLGKLSNYEIVAGAGQLTQPPNQLPAEDGKGRRPSLRAPPSTRSTS